MHLTKNIPGWLAALLIVGCTHNVVVPVPENLKNTEWSDYLTASGLADTQRAEPQWWRSYQDEGLNKLIQAALLDNLDLKIALSRIREARASRQAELAAMAPVIGINASQNEQQLSETGSLPVGRIPGFEIRQTIYQAGVEAAWEIDLFGRNPKRRLIAESRYLNQLELQYDLHLAVVAEVTQSYFQLRGLQAQRDVVLQMVAQQQRILAAVQAQHEHGEASSTEVHRAAAGLAEYQAMLPTLDAQIRNRIYQISVLAGLPPDALSSTLTNFDKLPEVVTNGLAGVSSDLLRRRADVRHAEREYVIANQQQKLAKLAIYPSFSLFGNAGPNTIDFDNFLDNESLAFNFGGLIRWPLYNGGQLRAQDAIAKERTLQAEYNYANTVLRALQEVESIGAGLIAATKELVARKSVYAAEQRIANDLHLKYQAGLISLVAWLGAEQQVLQRRQAQVATQSQLLQNSVALHKSLGGGWILFSRDQSG